jgi:hypothetical protein
VQQELRVVLGHKELRDHRDLKVRLVRKETLVLKELRERLGHRGQLEHKEV